jgi:NAD-dependent dihydropyrimidine dehydrogenase PreA subunit
MSELPQLNETRCTGCGDCVVVCPTQCLAMDGALPYLIRPRECISCTLCVYICPEDALRMEEEESE